MSENSADITALLRAAASGERRDLDALMTAIYDDLRRLAAAHMRAERSDHTLQPTILVHEAYVKLIDQRRTDWQDRVHFFALASRIIRRILCDHARGHEALKRGGGQRRVQAEAVEPEDSGLDFDLLALDHAMSELAQLDERQAKIVELRFFGGCTLEEIAGLLGVARRTVDREWCAARAWLFERLSDGDAPHGDDGLGGGGNAVGGDGGGVGGGGADA